MLLLLSLVVLFPFTIPKRLEAQNIVLNPSFENSTGCPSNYGQFSLVSNWSVPNTGTPDYFKHCATSTPCYTDVPLNGEGHRNAHDGVAYAGIFNQTRSGLSPWREYIKGELNTSLLKPNTWYKVSFWASLCDHNSVGAAHLGFYVGSGCTSQSNRHLVYPVLPTWEHPTVITDTNWTQVTGYYYSLNGDEDCLIIGIWDATLITQPVPGLPLPCLWTTHHQDKEVAVYIDDVSMTEEPVAHDCNCNDQAYQIKLDPIDPTTPGECCWNVSIKTAYNACPLNKVNITLPGASSSSFTWQSSTAIQPQTSVNLGTMCVSNLSGTQTVGIDYLNQVNGVMCSTTRDITCTCACDNLKVHTVRDTEVDEDGFCCYNVVIENPAACSVPVSEIGYMLQSPFVFRSATNGAWTKVGSAGGPGMRWKASTTTNLLPPHSSTTVGYFCINESLERQVIDVTFYKNQYGESPELSCTSKTSAYCAGFSEDCCEKLFFYVRPEMLETNVPDPNHWHLHLFGTEFEELPCGIVSAEIRLNPFKSTYHVTEWGFSEEQPLTSPVWGPYVHFDLGGATTTTGFDPSELLLVLYDANGNVICVKQGASEWPEYIAPKRVPSNRTIDRHMEDGLGSDDGDVMLMLAPNPASGDVSIDFRLSSDAYVSIDLFDLQGMLVEQISRKEMSSGRHSLVYSASKLASGIYRVRLSYPGYATMSTLTVTH